MLYKTDEGLSQTSLDVRCKSSSFFLEGVRKVQRKIRNLHFCLPVLICSKFKWDGSEWCILVGKNQMKRFDYWWLLQFPSSSCVSLQRINSNSSVPWNDFSVLISTLYLHIFLTCTQHTCLYLCTYIFIKPNSHLHILNKAPPHLDTIH